MPTLDILTDAAISVARTLDVPSEGAIGLQATADVPTEASISLPPHQDVASEAAVSVEVSSDVPTDASISTVINRTFALQIEAVPPQGFAGIPESELAPGFDIASRLRCELYGWDTTNVPGAHHAIEQIGAKVGTGLVETIEEFHPAPKQDASGQFRLVVPAADPATLPILSGQAKVIFITYEGVGPYYWGRIEDKELRADGRITVTGYDLSVKLSDRASLWRLLIENKTPLKAFVEALDFVTWVDLEVNFESFPFNDRFSRSFGGQTILEVLNDLGVIADAHWRWNAATNTLTIGGFGDASGLNLSAIDEYDPRPFEEGELVLTGAPVYKETTGPMVNFLVPQGANQATGTAVALNHAHNRGFKLGDAEPLWKDRFQFESSQIPLSLGGGVHIEDSASNRTVPLPLPISMQKVDINAITIGPATVEVPGTAPPELQSPQLIDVLSPYAFWYQPPGDYPWILGATVGDFSFSEFETGELGYVGTPVDITGLAQRITLDQDTEIAWIALRTGGNSPWLRLWGDSGDLPDPSSVLAIPRRATNWESGSPPDGLDLHAMGIAPVMNYYCFNPPLQLSAGHVWLVASLNDQFDTTTHAHDLIPFAMGGINGESAIYTNGRTAVRDENGTWLEDQTGNVSWVFEVSGRVVGDTRPLVEGMFAGAVNEESDVRPDETNPWGHIVFFMRDLDAIEANWQVERPVSLSSGHDARDGLERVWPASDVLYDSAATYLRRAAVPHKQLRGPVTNAYRLPRLGQTVHTFRRWYVDTANGPHLAHELNQAMYVLAMEAHFTRDGLTHDFTVSNVPEDFLDPQRVQKRWERFFQTVTEAQGELAVGSNSGARFDPTIIEA